MEYVGMGQDRMTYVICRFGNLCTVEFEGWCSECVDYYSLFPDYGE